MQDYFHALADTITAHLQGREVYTCTFRGEDSDFVRFNRSAVRQAGTVRQRALSLDLIEGQRHAAGNVALSGDLHQDGEVVTRLLEGLREQLPFLPEDPHLLYATEVQSSIAAGRNELPERAEAVDAVLRAGRGRDLVGLYAAGAIYVGLFEMGITFILWLSAMKLTDHTARIGNLIFLSPFLSLVFIHFLVGEDIFPSTYVGLTLIIAGLVVQQKKPQSVA